MKNDGTFSRSKIEFSEAKMFGFQGEDPLDSEVIYLSSGFGE